VAEGGVDPSDELVSHLLLVHGLHPEDVETRVAQALEEVRPYLGSHGGDVELLGVADGIARVRLVGTCDGCPSSTATLRYAIEEAVAKAAPELDGVEAEGVAEPAPQQLLQIGSLVCPPELVSR
jgi:Fe-S cluster biogenesis protein NfuA